MLVFSTQMHLVTFVFVSVELVILFYLWIHKLARPDDHIIKLNIILISLLLIYNITGGLLPDPKLPGSFFIQEAIAYATGFITPCYFPFYVYHTFGLKQLKFHAYRGVFLFLIIPYLVFVGVFAITGNLREAQNLLILPVLYSLWVIISLIKGIRKNYLKNRSSTKSNADIIVLLLSITPWIGLPVITYFNLSQTIEALITNLGFLLLFGLQTKRDIKQARMEHERLKRWNTDLREQVKLRTEQLEKINEQRINNFINLVHEIKTPVTLVKNYLDDYISQHDKTSELEIIMSGVDKLAADMINLFDVERFTKGINVYNHNQITDFSNILINNIAFFENFLARRNITLKKNIENDIFIKADPNAINRIINNIIENAVKYSDNGDTVKIILKAIGDLVSFIVDDTGMGIATEKQDKIFEPYFQISHRTTALQGMGLGLSIVKKIVDNLNGTISVKSNPNLKRGTKVNITLDRHTLQILDNPCRRAKRLKSTIYDLFDHDLTEKAYDKDKKTVLLIEDSKSMFHFLYNKLSDKYNVFYAFDGAAALKVLKEQSVVPDLILSDIMMDKMDGFSFAKVISEQTRYNYIPLIFLTAKSNPSDVLQGYNSGAIDYIQKPFSFSLLSHKIENVLNTIDRQRRAMINNTLLYLDLQNDENEISTREGILTFDQICKTYRLTNRQIEIVELLKEGKSYKEIAASLFISDRTVTKHMQNIFEKTGVSNKIGLFNKLTTTNC